MQSFKERMSSLPVSVYLEWPNGDSQAVKAHFPCLGSVTRPAAVLCWHRLVRIQSSSRRRKRGSTVAQLRCGAIHWARPRCERSTRAVPCHGQLQPVSWLSELRWVSSVLSPYEEFWYEVHCIKVKYTCFLSLYFFTCLFRRGPDSRSGASAAGAWCYELCPIWAVKIQRKWAGLL